MYSISIGCDWVISQKRWKCHGRIPLVMVNYTGPCDLQADKYKQPHKKSKSTLDCPSNPLKFQKPNSLPPSLTPRPQHNLYAALQKS